jgi:DNA-binding Lrp family transcriptional regulator
MTVRAYVLINTEVGRAGSVAEAIRAIPGVETSDDVTGPYDVIARATTSSIEELGRVVVTQIQMVEGITGTLTCPIVSTD